MDRESNMSSDPILFGEVPPSESDNNSTGLRLSKSSIMSDDGDHIQVSDMEEERNIDDDGNFVKAKNDLNAQNGNGQPTNGNITPYYKIINNNHAFETIAVIDIDGDGEYMSLLSYF